jgi:hypothetical protein
MVRFTDTMHFGASAAALVRTTIATETAPVRSEVPCVNHIDGVGRRLFEKVYEMDLEGIVAKRKDSLYRVTEKPSPDWVKIRIRGTVNRKGVRNYSSVFNMKQSYRS